MNQQEINKKLGGFKGLILDADGVLFNGHEYRAVMGDEVTIMKKRSFHDAQGLSFLRGLGIKIVFATGEGEPLQSVMAKINNLPSVMSGEWAPVDFFMGELNKGGKVTSCEAWLQKHDLSWDECVYIGDDRTDLEAMQKAGLKVVPSNARRIVKKIADIILQAKGGEGAIRDFTEMVLDVRNVDESMLPTA